MEHYIEVAIVDSVVAFRSSSAVVNNRRPLCFQDLWYDAKAKQETGQLHIAVATFLFQFQQVYVNK